MTTSFCKAYCKLHMAEFERGRQHGRWTILWNEDRAYCQMRKRVKRMRRKNGRGE